MGTLIIFFAFLYHYLFAFDDDLLIADWIEQLCVVIILCFILKYKCISINIS